MSKWIDKIEDIELAGDYFWMTMWACDCCIQDCGALWIIQMRGPDDRAIYTWTKDGQKWGMFPEGPNTPYMHEGKPVIHYLMLIQLPAPKR